MTDWRDLADSAKDGFTGRPGDYLDDDTEGAAKGDWKGGEYTPAGDPDRKLFDPPIVRHSAKRPSYRQWLDILHRQRNVFLIAHGGWGWDPQEWIEPVLDKHPAKDLKILEARGCPAENIDAVVKIRKHYTLMKSFASAVLAGGPESVWVAKPLDPKSLHSDVVAFYSAGKPGIGKELIEASTMCWELYDAWLIPSSNFETVARLLEEEERARHTITVVREASGETHELGSESYGETPESASMGRAFDAAMEGMARVLGDGTDPGESVASADRRGRKIEEAILAEADKAMLDRMGHREYRDSGASPGNPPRVRCTYMRQTKRFGEWQCSHWSVYGSDRCEAHGGDLVDIEETKSLLKNSQQMIFGASLRAVSTIVEIMETSTNDQVKLRAAETILNRAGINEQTDLSITLGTDDIAAARPSGEIVRERLMNLAGLKSGELDAARKREEDDRAKFAVLDGIVDAEVVEDSE